MTAVTKHYQRGLLITVNIVNERVERIINNGVIVLNFGMPS